MHQIKSLLPLLLVTFYVSSLRKPLPDLYTRIDILRACLPWPLEADLLGTCTWFRHWEGTRVGILASFFFFSILIKVSYRSLSLPFSKPLESPCLALSFLQTHATESFPSRSQFLILQKQLTASPHNVEAFIVGDNHPSWCHLEGLSMLDSGCQILVMPNTLISWKKKKNASHTRQSMCLLSHQKLEALGTIYGFLTRTDAGRSPQWPLILPVGIWDDRSCRWRTPGRKRESSWLRGEGLVG